MTSNFLFKLLCVIAVAEIPQLMQMSWAPVTKNRLSLNAVCTYLQQWKFRNICKWDDYLKWRGPWGTECSIILTWFDEFQKKIGPSSHKNDSKLMQVFFFNCHTMLISWVVGGWTDRYVVGAEQRYDRHAAPSSWWMTIIVGRPMGFVVVYSPQGIKPPSRPSPPSGKPPSLTPSVPPPLT